MKLPRPHIPVAVRLEVAVRQYRACNKAFPKSTNTLADSLLQLRLSDGRKLRWFLTMLFGIGSTPELHHRPALCNRQRYADKTGIHYDPPANDPEFLVYLPADDHDIETRVRGVGAQHSDLALRRKNKNIARNRDPKRRRHRWPKRRLRA